MDPWIQEILGEENILEPIKPTRQELFELEEAEWAKFNASQQVVENE